MSSVNLQSLEELRGTLIRRGIPPRYVHRVTTELREHAEDLSENGESDDASLGELSALADEITHTYQARTFAGRHPWFVFGILSLPFTIITYVAWLFVSVVTATFEVQPLLKGYDFAKAFVMIVTQVSVTVVPSILCTWAICRVARRAGLHWKRVMLACVPVMLMALHLVSGIHFEPTAEMHGSIHFGLCLPWIGNYVNLFGWQQPVQAAIPVLILVGMMARESRRSLELSN